MKASLFHLITDENSAIIRKAIVDKNLIDQINFRNIDRSEDAKKSLQDLLKGELTVPTLLIDDQVYAGLEACLTALNKFK